MEPQKDIHSESIHDTASMVKGSASKKHNVKTMANANQPLRPVPINKVPKTVPASQLAASQGPPWGFDQLRPHRYPHAPRYLPPYVPSEEMKQRGYYLKATDPRPFPASHGPGFPSVPQYPNNARLTNSIVITNSRMPFPNQNMALTGISFNDTICLGLPPKVTWEELNESPTDNSDVLSLLHYTRELNEENSKRRRSRSIVQTKTKTANQSSSKSTERPRSFAMTVAPTRKTKPEKPQSKTAVQTSQLKKENSAVAKVSEQNTGATDKLKLSALVANSTETNVAAVRSSNVSVSGRRNFTVVNLLKMQDDAPVDPKIIECIKRVKGLFRSSPRKNIRLLTESFPYEYKESCKQPKKTDVGGNRDVESNSKTIGIKENVHTDDDKLKHLMEGSWLDSDGDADSNSKEIFESLEGMIKKLKSEDEFSKSGSPENLKPTSEVAVKRKKNKRKFVVAAATINDVLGSKSSDVLDSVTMSSVEKTENAPVSTAMQNLSLVAKPKKKMKKKKVSKTVEEAQNVKPAETPDSENLLFDEYYDEATVEKGLQAGTLFKEILRINTKNSKESYIYYQADNKDIFIDGVKDRNRALDGDEVVVELRPEEGWKWYQDDTVQKCGKVVAITQKNHPRTAVGYLKIVYGKLSGIIVWPRDNRLPRIRVSENSCPPKFRYNHKRYESTLFLAKITSWDAVKSAEGVVVEMLGDETALDVQSKCILEENNLDVAPFENVDEHLPADSHTISVDEMGKRMDLRSRCIFTIDPPMARDLDDSLSCSVLPNGHVEVGIHIADVTHYIVPDSPLDDNAREKATSVYLTEKVFHMLPMKLCELCSLTPGEDKLTFSVFATLDESANVVDHRFFKTVIRSCTQLTYDHAQEVIDKRNEDIDAQLFPAIGNGFSVTDCADAIWVLHQLAAKMRKRRFTEGALRIDQPKLKFALDDTHMPTSFSLEEGKECNWLVEEFMLLANILTANRICEAFPETALLRCHASPKEKSLANVVEYLEKVGIHIDVSSAGAIFQSMTQYYGSDEIGVARMAVIMNLLVKPMPRAMYTCSVSSIDNCASVWHYALNTPFYTHFTSPIRRYADMVVHRLLAACLGLAQPPRYTSDDVTRIAANCNVKKNAAKKASEMSTELYLKLYLEKNGPVRVRAVVIDVKERFFDVIDLSLRTVGRVYADKIQNTEKVEFDNADGMPSLTISWKGDDANRTLVQIFMIVDVEISYKNTNKYNNNSLTVTLLKSTS